MTGLSLLFSLGVFFAAGGGIVLLLSRGGFRFGVCEFLALAWLLGTGGVSFALWLGGVLALRGIALQLSTAGVAMALLAFGIRGTSRNALPRWPKSLRPLDWALGAIIVSQLAALMLASYKHTLGWDGLVNWELKARYAFLNHGALPAEYFSAPGRSFTHPEYPLAVPFTELWLYLSLGEAHQFWAKAIFFLYYVAGATLLASLATRLTGRNWVGLLVAALLFVTPQVSVGTGGAVTGYADFPLSAIYLAAIGFLAVSALREDAQAFRLYAACLTLLPWFKREGAVLWIVAAAAGAFFIARAGQPRRFFVLLPGAAIICVWKIFLLAMHTAPSAEFTPLNAEMIARSPQRLGLIANALLIELTNLEQWSLLWYLLAAAAGYSLLRRRAVSVVLLWAIFVPIGLYSATYLFSAWPDVGKHIETSLPRLLMHVAPVAWLAIAVVIGFVAPRVPGEVSPLAACEPVSPARNRESESDASGPALA